MSNIKVLHCAETIKGGIATYLRDLLPLQRQSWGPGAVVVLIPASQRAELIAPDGVQVECYDDQGSRPLNALRLALRVWSLYRSLRPQVIHLHSTFAGAMARPLLWLGRCRAKVVYCAHGWAWDRPMSPLKTSLVQWFERLQAYLCDAIVCISEHERRTALLAGLPAARLHVVTNAVAAVAPVAEPIAVDWPPGKLRLLFVGRFDRQKGIDLLYQALPQLGDEVHALLAGGAVLADSDLPPPPANATELGWLTPGQLQTLFAEADLLVVPSRWEGFGLIATEAMRASLAVVACRVGGLGEIVVDGQTGVLIEPGDAVALATAVRRYNREQWQQMGRAGRQRFEQHFVMERLHRQLADCYRLPI